MKKEDRIRVMAWLGKRLGQEEGMENAIRQAGQANPFFTEEFCRLAIGSLASLMEENALHAWLSGLPEPQYRKKVGLIMAGNLPLVGWHDIMCIFLSGHICRYKCSSQDAILPDFLIGLLTENFPETASYFEKSEHMKGIEAIIATGSNASAASFDYYFRHIPRLIRGSKSSLGFLYGFEGQEELIPLCDDVMQYFGMGCRSVTKLLLPAAYDFGPFFLALEKYRYLTDHHRFQNNAIYHKAIFLMNGDPFLENDILILREHQNLFSPPGVLNYQVYHSMEEAKSILENHRKDLQCMVSFRGQLPGSLPFGMAQQPGLEDYADGINTLDFLKFS